MWRPTIIYGVLASVLFVGEFMRRSFLQRMIETLSEKSLNYVPPYTRSNWRVLGIICIGYFIFLATFTIVVANRFSEATWVNINFFGFPGLTLLFYPIFIPLPYGLLPPE